VNKRNNTPSSDKHYRNALAVVMSEILFNVLPLIILTIVFAYQNKTYSLFYASEWSLTAAIFFGQAITKIVSAFISTRVPSHAQRVVATVTILIVLGLVPALVVFVLLLISTEPPIGLLLTQMILFVASFLSFIFIGGASEWIIAERHEKTKSG